MLTHVVGAVVVALTLAGQAAAQDGHASSLYGKHCMSCHGVRGTPTKQMRGVFRSLPDLADPKFYEQRPQAALVAVILNGKAPNMPSFKGKLTAPEATAVAQLLRGFATNAKD